MSQKLKVAVIGTGNIGKAVAQNLVKGERSIIIADRIFQKAETLSRSLGARAKPATIADAIQEADILVLAVWFDAIKALFSAYAEALQGKIIVDPSNPIAPDEKGGFKKIIDKDQSSGQVLAALLPDGAKLAKALGTLGAEALCGAAFQTPDKAVLFYATDDTSINSAIEELIQDSGFEPVRIGSINQSVRIEVFGDLHQFGALGKTITRSEASSLLAK